MLTSLHGCTSSLHGCTSSDTFAVCLLCFQKLQPVWDWTSCLVGTRPGLPAKVVVEPDCMSLQQ